MITGLATAAFAKQVEKQAEIMKLCFNNLEKDQEQIEKTEQQVELALEWLREVETVSTPAVSTAESTSQIIVTTVTYNQFKKLVRSIICSILL